MAFASSIVSALLVDYIPDVQTKESAHRYPCVPVGSHLRGGYSVELYYMLFRNRKNKSDFKDCFSTSRQIVQIVFTGVRYGQITYS